MTMRERYQVAKDEGVRYRSYMDSLNYLTGGIGHLMSEGESAQYPEGTAIPSTVVEAWFNEDMLTATEIADKLLDGSAPDELHDIITNMAFNLGESRLRKFKKMWVAIGQENFNAAAEEMKDSVWYTQVGHRSKRLYIRMQLLGERHVDSTDTCTG